MNDIKKLPNSFFTKLRPKAKGNKNDYSKIEEIKWNKDILNGKNRVVGSSIKNT